MIEKVPARYEDLSELLDSAFYELGAWTDIPFFFRATCLPVSEKLEQLERFVRVRPSPKLKDPQRLLHALAICRYVDGERKRILGIFLAVEGSDTMYPMTQLAVKLDLAGRELQAALEASVEGFLRPLPGLSNRVDLSDME